MQRKRQFSLIFYREFGPELPFLYMQVPYKFYLFCSDMTLPSLPMIGPFSLSSLFLFLASLPYSDFLQNCSSLFQSYADLLQNCPSLFQSYAASFQPLAARSQPWMFSTLNKTYSLLSHLDSPDPPHHIVCQFWESPRLGTAVHDRPKTGHSNLHIPAQTILCI